MGISVILFSWFLFILLPGAWFVILAFLFWFLFSLMLYKFTRMGRWRIEIKAWQHWLFWFLVVLFALLSPVFSYFYGQYYATNLFNGLNIEAEVVNKQVVLLDRFNQFDYAAPARSFTIEYQVNEPLDIAKNKIEQSIVKRPLWHADGPIPNTIYPAPLVIEAWCSAPRRSFLWPFSSTDITLYETGQMYVSFTYEQQKTCTD